MATSGPSDSTSGPSSAADPRHPAELDLEGGDEVVRLLDREEPRPLAHGGNLVIAVL